MRCIEGIGDLDREGKQDVEIQRTASNRVLQGLAFEELHRDEGAAVLLADVVDGADVRVIERRGRLGFALEARQRSGVQGNFVGQKLQCDEAVKAGVLSLINHAHTSTTEFFNDLIVGDGPAEHWAEMLWV